MAPNFDNKKSLFDFVVGEGNGVKGMVDTGLSYVPQAYVQPAEERIDKKRTRIHEDPPIDLSKLNGSEHDGVVDQIIRAAETLGFFQVVNHGVPVELLASLKTTAHNFFAMPPEKKAVYRKGVSPSPLVKYGTSFVPEKENALEWKDYVSMVYTNDDDALRYWPKECRKLALEYLKRSTRTVKNLIEILIGNMTNESKIEDLTAVKMVNMNFYPTCPNPNATIGVGRHSDMGMLTLLLQDGIGGLYVKVEGNNKEEWVEIPPIAGSLVINVGDTLQILSNGRYKSAEHRVGTTNRHARVSIPIFIIPKPTEKIAPLPKAIERDGVTYYREFIYQDYMNNFFGNKHEGKKSLDFAKI